MTISPREFKESRDTGTKNTPLLCRMDPRPLLSSNLVRQGARVWCRFAYAVKPALPQSTAGALLPMCMPRGLACSSPPVLHRSPLPVLLLFLWLSSGLLCLPPSPALSCRRCPLRMTHMWPSCRPPRCRGHLYGCEPRLWRYLGPISVLALL